MTKHCDLVLSESDVQIISTKHGWWNINQNTVCKQFESRYQWIANSGSLKGISALISCFYGSDSFFIPYCLDKWMYLRDFSKLLMYFKYESAANILHIVSLIDCSLRFILVGIWWSQWPVCSIHMVTKITFLEWTFCKWENIWSEFGTSLYSHSLHFSAWNSRFSIPSLRSL